MRFLGFIHSKKHRGQMFILATMLIAVYIVTMTAALMNLGAERVEIDREALREPYLDSKRELQRFMELILAEHTRDVTKMTLNLAKAKMEEFLVDMKNIYLTRGVNLRIQLYDDSLTLITAQPPYENIAIDEVYSSEIYAEFNLEMSVWPSAITIEESFLIGYTGRAEIQNEKIIIQQSFGKQFEFVEVGSINVFNGSYRFIPTSIPDQTGIYHFEDVSLDNLGVLNVTLMNGVQILS